MADHAVDLGVDQLLRNGRALFRIGAVIFQLQLELDRLAVDLEAFGVQFLDSHFGAVFIVLAKVSRRT